jgi:XTP/dITP diphosphohydrolase
MKLVFATNNSHKIKEVEKMLPEGVNLLKLKDIDCFDDLPETGTTLMDNARQKARYIYEKFGLNCFADDSGIEVSALGGRPGVYSARFAGSSATSSENISKLLIELKGITDRTATFRTVIALIIDGKEYFFEGSINGHITETLHGAEGFGYDPVFIPSGSEMTFAEMNPEEKNSLSHRAIAMKKFSEFLKTPVNYS